ncbi:hypothetical protein [Paenibacillus elgii]|uniref:hypothetical protein n=1 Tax=Paenibacillus elgii TaxID=189691 RepID=UPI000248C7D2|nr:hypothetical protein [Paenibacillus elgii]
MKIKNVNGKEFEVKVGDQVQLVWYGDSNIPKHLAYTWATVIKITNRGNLVVEAMMDAYGTRTAVPNRHIIDVQKEDKKTAQCTETNKRKLSSDNWRNKK